MIKKFPDSIAGRIRLINTRMAQLEAEFKSLQAERQAWAAGYLMGAEKDISKIMIDFDALAYDTRPPKPPKENA